MKVLVACEYSGRVRDAFTALEHDTTSCDLLPTETPGQHYQGSVLDILDDGWDLMVAHPPCTYLSNSGVRWLGTQEGRWEKMEEGASFFKQLLEADIPRVCIENPIMHGHGIQRIGGEKATQIVQPWMFGHTQKKATCLWLKGLPKLVPTEDVRAEMEGMSKAETQAIWYCPPGKDRQKIRSLTFPGIAKAMASQWGRDS